MDKRYIDYAQILIECKKMEIVQDQYNYNCYITEGESWFGDDFDQLVKDVNDLANEVKENTKKYFTDNEPETKLPDLQSDTIDFNKMKEDVMRGYVSRHNTRADASMRLADMEVENRVQTELMKKELNIIERESQQMAKNVEQANAQQLATIEKKNNENIKKMKGSKNKKIIRSVLGVGALVSAVILAKKIHERRKRLKAEEQEKERNRNF